MSKTPDQWCDEGNTLNGQGKKQEAVDAYDEAINIDPNFGRAYYGKAIVVADLNRVTEAIELYKKAISVGHATAPTYYNMGIDLNSLGRREEAVEAYTKALEKDPKKADAYRNRGNSLMMLNRVQEAVDSYAKALELKPELHAVYADIGPLLEDLGKRDEAVKYYDICISKDPRNFRSNYSKGCLLYKEGKYQECLKNLEVSLSVNNLHPGTNYHMGSAYAAMGNKAKAMEFFNKADQMKPEISIQYCNRGQCYYLLGKKKEALQDLLKAQDLLENDKKTMLLPNYINAMKKTIKNVLEAEKSATQTEAAIQQLNAQDPAVKDLLANLKKLQEEQNKAQEKMVTKLNQKEAQDGVNELAEVQKQLAGLQDTLGVKIVETAPAKTPDQWCDEGNTLNGQGKKNEAEKAYNEALAIDPKFGRAYYGKAIVVADLNRETEAVELYKKAISVGHDTAPTYYNMGIDLNALGRREEAVEAYTKAVEKDPKKADAFRNRGNSLMMLGRSQEAVDSYAKALELKPELYAVYADIGPLLEDLGKRDEAVKYYDLCISKDPRNFRSNYSKGCLLYKEGKYQESIKHLEVSLSVNNLHPGTNYFLGQCYMGLGDKDKAMTYFGKADQMKPEISIQYCNRAQCYFALGQKEKGLADFKKTRELLESDKKTMLLPTYINFMKSALRTVLESDTVAKQTEEQIKKLDQQNPVVQKFIKNIKKLQEDQDELQNKVVGNFGKTKATELRSDVNELDRLKEEFKKQFEAMQQEIGQLKNKVSNVEQEVKKIKSNMEELREELDNKMDDFNKKLDRELDKQDLTPDDKAKLKGYYSAFIGTFSAIHITSQVVDSGQVKLDAGTTTGTVLSFLASFAPFVGNSLSNAVSTVDEFLHSQQMIKNARRMKGLAHDAVALSQLVGKSGFSIITDKKKQQSVLGTTEQDLKKISGNLFQKVLKICENINESIDAYLYTELYKTPAERVGHNDANELVEKWINGTITPYGIEEQFVSETLKEKTVEVEGQSPTSPNKVEAAKQQQRSACCNMF